MTRIPDCSELDPNEFAITITDEHLDDLGRAQFFGHWLDDYLPPSGVRGQVFNTNVAGWVARQEREGRKVTALDEHTHQILDSLGLRREA